MNTKGSYIHSSMADLKHCHSSMRSATRLSVHLLQVYSVMSWQRLWANPAYLYRLKWLACWLRIIAHITSNIWAKIFASFRTVISSKYSARTFPLCDKVCFTWADETPYHTYMHMQVLCQCIHLPSCGLGAEMSIDTNFQQIQPQRLWLSTGISRCFLSRHSHATCFVLLNWCQLPSTVMDNSKSPI